MSSLSMSSSSSLSSPSCVPPVPSPSLLSPSPPPACPIADLHGDLLCYLEEDPTRTPDDRAVRCGIPQLQEGKVAIQVLPIFTETQPKSGQKGLAQAELYRLLFVHHSLTFIPLTPTNLSSVLENGKIALLPAIENASSFCEEHETFAQGMERLRLFFGKMGRPLYISFTWNSENRFGGGAETDIGLKDDGKRLLDFLHMKQIALDLSHASDRMAEEMLLHIDQNNLVIPVIASHSNVRAITDVRRNLPDFLLEELKKRGGIVGANVIRPFVGSSLREGFPEHIRALIERIGIERVSLGADFFCDLDLPAHRAVKCPVQGWFFPECPDASYYPNLLQLIREALGLSQEQIEKIAYGNFLKFVHQLWKVEQQKPEQQKAMSCCV